LIYVAIIYVGFGRSDPQARIIWSSGFTPNTFHALARIPKWGLG